MKISTDKDTLVNYEYITPLRGLINKAYVPILNSLPPGARGLIKRTHKSAEKVIEHATTHHAIEVLYKFGEPEKSKNLFQRFFHYIWFSTNNSKAVRNRLKLVTKKVKESISRELMFGNDISILSIAAGSARGILDAISMNELRDKGAMVTFLDKNPQAHEYSKGLINERHYADNFKFRWIVDTANNFPDYYKTGDQPNIIEIVGLLDYFDKPAIKRLFKSVLLNLRPNGTFITSNIVDNSERKFITDVVGWDMLYKTPEDFYEIAREVGFKDENIELVYEPFKIHFIMVARK